MKLSSKHGTALAVVLIGLAILFVGSRKAATTEQLPSMKGEQGHRSSRVDREDRGENQRIKRAASRDSSKEELARLKQRWVDLHASTADSAQREELARETVQVLSISAELIELDQFLKSQKISPGPGGDLAYYAASLFDSPHAEKARSGLARLPDRFFTAGSGSRVDIVYRWCEAAGLNCPADQFEDFLREMSSEYGSQIVKLGYSRRVFENDPVKAIEMTADVVTNLSNESHRLSQLTDSIPLTVDFHEVVSALHRLKDDRELHNQTKSQLVKRWAYANPAELMSHINQHPDEYSAEHIRIAANASDAVLEHIPVNRADYRDSALVGIIERRLASFDLDVDSMHEVQKLAEQIVDPGTREKAQDRLTGVLRAIENDEDITEGR